MIMDAKALHKRLPWWERNTLTPDDLWVPGWLPAGVLTRATAALTLLLMPLLALGGMPLALAAPVFARLLALDLTAYTLPNVYTLPLLAAGLSHAAYMGHPWQAGLAAGLLALGFIAPRFPVAHGLGGGDFKLLAAMLAWLPLQAAAFAMAIGCFLWLPLAFWRPRTPQPFGVPLLVGWVLIIAFPHLPEGVLRPMLGW